MEIPYRFVGNINDLRLIQRSALSIGEGIDFATSLFDAYYRAASRRPLVFNYGMHPLISGRPDHNEVLVGLLDHMRSRKDVWVCTYDEMAAWWRERFEGRVPSGGGYIPVK